MRGLVGLLLIGCGGTLADPTDGGDAATDSAVTSDAADCQQLLDELEAEGTTAAQCCPNCKSLQCTQQIDGICCTLTVSDPTSAAAQQYLAMLAKVRSLGCGPASCPSPQVLGCSTSPTGSCTSSAVCAQ